MSARNRESHQRLLKEVGDCADKHALFYWQSYQVRGLNDPRTRRHLGVFRALMASWRSLRSGM
jgi:hypothetical protein